MPQALPLEVEGADLRVPLVSGEQVRYVNLDCAASPPCLRAAHEAVRRALPWYGSVNRGAGFASAVSTRLLASARESIRGFAGARPDDAVIFTRHTTEALNLLARALPEDTAVVVFGGEHHANLLPWRRARFLQLPVPRRREEIAARAGEALSSLRARHKLLAVTGASNVTGELWPLEELCAAARRQGARVAVDAAQLAAHRRIDLAALGADFLALSGHKLHAPFGCGALIGRADWLDAARPWLAGGGAARSVSPQGVEWASGPARHEGGTPNLLGAAAFAAAGRALEQAGWEALEAHESALLEELLEGLRALPEVKVLSLWGPRSPRIGVVSFTVRGWEPALLASALSAEHGIGVRDGAFCAHPLVAELLRDAGEGRPSALRASFGAANPAGDVRRLLAALRKILSRGLGWRYAPSGGGYLPDPDPRPQPDLGFLSAGPADLRACGA
ncbi:MAG TPA: aminotransferase class V-fold PLP-dependent enzyme [Myxococcales bacterium]|nr:aminotransferase class V-fold PLP-dependent enzyme [Myxococcales bacterium]